MEKKGKQSELIGKIILADLLEYTLEKFINFIREVEGLPLYNKLVWEGIIIRKPLSIDDFRLTPALPARHPAGGRQAGGRRAAGGSGPGIDDFQSGDGVIAKIKKDINFNFPIQYAREEFSVEYSVNSEKLLKVAKLPEEQKRNISSLLHKLRRISTRNRIMHEILKGIVEYQRDYFQSDCETENELDLKLKPLPGAELARILSDCKESNQGRDFVIDASRISRVTQGTSIITPQGKEVSLKSLFPTKRDIVKRYIKAILRKEGGDIRNEGAKRPYTDEELRLKLKNEYNLSITRREVTYCRKGLGILPYSKRINSYGYPPLLANFSKIYPFTISSVKKTLPPFRGYMNFFWIMTG